MASNQATNRYVISAQLDAASHKRLFELMAASGYSKSKMIRVLIMGATVRHTTSVEKGSASSTDDDVTKTK